MSNEAREPSQPPAAAEPQPTDGPADAPEEPAAAPAPAAAGRPSLLGRIGEWFWRGGAIARAAKVDEADRSATREVLELAEQRGEAAETLWTTGHLAEALRLAADALKVALELPHGAERLTRLGASEADRERLAQARAALAETAPLRDGELKEAHTERYLALQAGRRTLTRLHGDRVAPQSSLRWQRAQRIGGVVAGLAAVCVGLWLVLRTPPRTEVRASDQFPGAQYAPDNAFDGNESTEWVLPDGQTGWIEGRLFPAQNIESLRILNGRNARFGDRAVKEYKVQLYRGEQLLGEHEGVFERIEAAPQWVDIPLKGEGVTRIRFEALGSHRRGPALAEIAWDD